MHIKKVTVSRFRRSSDLEIDGIPPTADLVILSGPNGNGKSSPFDAFLNFADQRGGRANWDQTYHQKLDGQPAQNCNHPRIEFHEANPTDQKAWRKPFYFRSADRNDPDFQAGSISRVVV